MPTSVPTAVLSLEDSLRFIESAALMHSISEGTQLEWRTYNDSTALNIAYFLLPWKEKPGYAEVTTPTGQRVEERTRLFYREFSDRWLERLGRGPQAAKDYMESLERIRATDLDRVNGLFNEARKINDEVNQQLKTAIRTFAAIKLTGTLAVAGLGAGAAIAIGGTTALIAGGISAGYSITGAIIKDWHNVPTAKIMGVSKETGKYVASEGLGRTAQVLGEQARGRAALHAQILAKSERQIEHYSKQMAESAKQRVQRKAAQKLAEKQAQHQGAQQGMRQAATMGKVGRVGAVGIPIVFALWDSVEGVMDFKETWDQTR